jgi:hypothetical protein
MLFGPKSHRGLVLIAVIFISLGSLVYAKYSAGKRIAKGLENRALVIVVENNFGVPDEISALYGKSKERVDPVLAFIFKTEKENLAGMDLAEVVDAYGEDYLAGRYAKAASGYGKVVVLTDEKASYSNFEDTLLALGAEKRTIDILLDLHGSEGSICFHKECIDKDYISFTSSIKSSFPPDIGFVYQTLCYGGQNMEPWIKKGAKAVNGAEGVNNFVILAPEKFLRSWTSGDGFAEAVEKGYSLEVSVHKILNKIFSGYALTEESLSSGRMLFAGENNYSF